LGRGDLFGQEARPKLKIGLITDLHNADKPAAAIIAKRS
jgi:hypothetical protein